MRLQVKLATIRREAKAQMMSGPQVEHAREAEAALS